MDSISSRFDLRHAATDQPSFVTSGSRRVFAIDGRGSPTAAEFALARATLRDVERRLESWVRDRHLSSPGQTILECVWWWPEDVPVGTALLQLADRSGWRWRQMIEVDGTASEEEALAAIADTARQGQREVPLVRVTLFGDGAAAQILHLGRRSEQAATVRRLLDAVRERGLEAGSYLHELDLADEHDVPAARARSILRLPVVGAGSAGAASE